MNDEARLESQHAVPTAGPPFRERELRWVQQPNYPWLRLGYATAQDAESGIPYIYLETREGPLAQPTRLVLAITEGADLSYALNVALIGATGARRV